MAENNLSNQDYSEKPSSIQPLRKSGLIIYFGKDGKVADVRAEQDAMRLYKPKNNSK